MIYLNLGRREVGKTTLAYYLISKSPRRVIFDPRGLFPATVRAMDSEQVFNQFELVRQGRATEIVITPDSDLQGCFDQACSCIKEYLQEGKDGIAFLIDELRFVPDTDGPALNWILRCATRDSVAVVFTCHRPVDVSVDIRAISDVWCVFQMTQENDLRVVAERCSPSMAQQVSKLPPRHFLAWNDAIGRMTAHTHPDRWYLALAPAAPVTRGKAPIDALDGDDIATNDTGRFNFT